MRGKVSEVYVGAPCRVAGNPVGDADLTQHPHTLIIHSPGQALGRERGMLTAGLSTVDKR